VSACAGASSRPATAPPGHAPVGLGTQYIDEPLLMDVNANPPAATTATRTPPPTATPTGAGSTPGPQLQRRRPDETNDSRHRRPRAERYATPPTASSSPQGPDQQPGMGNTLAAVGHRERVRTSGAAFDAEKGIYQNRYGIFGRAQRFVQATRWATCTDLYVLELSNPRTRWMLLDCGHASLR